VPGLEVAHEAGECAECACRYRAGELVVNGPEGAFHADCWRTRGSIELRPYEDQQPVELDLLLIALKNDVATPDQA